MNSIKNHISLIIALLSIIFSIQILTIVDRAIDAYKNNLTDNYTVIVVSQKRLQKYDMLSFNSLISDSIELKPDNVIKRLNSGIEEKNIRLLKLTMPKFYKLHLKHYPTPVEIESLKSDLYKNKFISKVEDFSKSHNVTYKLLLLFKGVVSIFSSMIFIVTILLIFKELRIWQFKHTERMNIMGLFGASVWLRSAILFRLAIVDAIVASGIAFITFDYLSSNRFVLEQFKDIGIDVLLFNKYDDSIFLFGTAIAISVLLASLIVMGHKEEV